MLLLAGFSLPFVVTVNLLVSFATRIAVALRLRAAVDRRRVALLVGGALPGLYAGARILDSVDEGTIKAVAGVLVMASAALLLLVLDRPAPRPVPGAPLVAGALGGLLGTTTSLIGIPPALLLARERVAARSLFADLAVYFVVASGAGVAVLAAGGALDGDALFPAFAVWLPGVLAANAVGTTAGLRLPERRFRLGILLLAFVAGALTLATS